jgi:hypothetical protein
VKKRNAFEVSGRTSAQALTLSRKCLLILPPNGWLRDMVAGSVSGGKTRAGEDSRYSVGRMRMIERPRCPQWLRMQKKPEVVVEAWWRCMYPRVVALLTMTLSGRRNRRRLDSAPPPPSISLFHHMPGIALRDGPSSCIDHVNGLTVFSTPAGSRDRLSNNASPQSDTGRPASVCFPSPTSPGLVRVVLSRVSTSAVRMHRLWYFG